MTSVLMVTGPAHEVVEGDVAMLGHTETDDGRLARGQARRDDVSRDSARHRPA